MLRNRNEHQKLNYFLFRKSNSHDRLDFSGREYPIRNKIVSGVDNETRQRIFNSKLRK